MMSPRSAKGGAVSAENDPEQLSLNPDMSSNSSQQPAPHPQQQPHSPCGDSQLPTLGHTQGVEPTCVGHDEEMAAPTSHGKVAAFFDLDKTIIATSSAYVFGKEFLNSGLISPATAVQLSLAKASYMFSGHSSEQMDSVRDQLTQMVAGWDVEQITQIARDTLTHTVTPTIYQEARELIDAHRAAGHDVVIISASASTLVEPIAEELGVEEVIATVLGEKDGKFTGEIVFYCKGEAKSQALKKLAEEKGYDLCASFAYSDSITDLPMLEAVANPVAVNPDRALRKVAVENGWEIRSFKNPVPLFPLPSGKELTVGTGVLAGLAAVTMGIFWWMKRPTDSS
ncbi:Phosphoserine phosphatase [Corynebacterium felinum]|uniref:HAD superfamily hydrolase (TIGR01490 family) n=2 Tax=Corynebacterium felinum TaxID=131318 RepID=A0ABU2B678_9CORY|nr:HAD superfamily hydrolase (TIGR01490 family) [Corynebacterium felinum]WJY96272.1 Phosphoserine phosphatase [Corynebacterium felinum]